MPVSGPRPLFSAFDVVALVVGIVVGAGIFRTPGVVARAAGSEEAALLAWVLGGAVSLIGALCYVELATAYPSTGGEYLYLRRSFGRAVGFLFVWARLTVIQSGSVALLAFLIADYLTRVLPFGPGAVFLYAAAPVATLVVANLLGLRVGSRVQAVLSGAMVAGLLAVVVSGFRSGAPLAAAAAPAEPAAGTAFGLAMVFVLLTFGGWNEASYVSAELRAGPLALRRALLAGVAVVTVLYVLVNLALFHGLGFAAVVSSDTVAADAAQRAFGPAGAALASLLVILAALSTMNATIITGARSAHAIGRDFARLGFLGRWRRQAGTPAPALLVQGGLALALVAAGAVTRRGFETMVEMTAPVFWLFFLLAGLSLIVLRVKEPRRPRPFPVPLYPLTPLLFCGSAAYMLVASLTHTGRGSVVGLIVLALGVPVYLVVRRRPAQGPALLEEETMRSRVLIPSLAAATLLFGAGVAAVMATSARTADVMAEAVPAVKKDVPYVPTPTAVVARMIELAEVRSGDVVYDLGCGDGRIVIAAVQTPGVRGVCVDIDPVRIQESRTNAKKAGVDDRIRFVEGDLFEVSFADATVVTMYLLPDVNMRLRPTLQALRPGTRIVSHAFDLGDWTPEQQVIETGSMIYRWTVKPRAAAQ